MKARILAVARRYPWVGPLAALILVYLLFVALRPDTFARGANLVTMARQTAVATVSSLYQQDFGPLASRYLVTGTPRQVVDRLLEYRDAGARTVIFSSPPDDRLRTTSSLLANEVMPALKESS